MLSPGQMPPPAAWVACGSARLDSAPLPFVQVPRPLPASRGQAPQYGGSRWSCHVEGARTLCGCHRSPNPAVFPWWGFPPASSLHPSGDAGHDEACTLLTSTLTAACFAHSPHASPPLGLSLLLQGSRLRVRLSLLSCSPVSWAFLGASLPPCAFLLFSLSSFSDLCLPGTNMGDGICGGDRDKEPDAGVCRVRKGRVPLRPPAPFCVPWCITTSKVERKGG